jgi:hypothetical protein
MCPHSEPSPTEHKVYADQAARKRRAAQTGVLCAVPGWPLEAPLLSDGCVGNESGRPSLFPMRAAGSRKLRATPPRPQLRSKIAAPLGHERSVSCTAQIRGMAHNVSAVSDVPRANQPRCGSSEHSNRSSR